MIAAKFDMMNAIAAELGEDNDCAVRAVAFATSKPYTEVRDKLKRKGRKNGQVTEVETFMAVVLQYKREFTLLPEYTGHTVISAMRMLKKGVYIVTTENHVFTVIDGEKADYRDGAADQVEAVFLID